jgi:hypothetical protein
MTRIGKSSSRGRTLRTCSEHAANRPWGWGSAQAEGFGARWPGLRVIAVQSSPMNRILFRTASVLMLLLGLGHTAGYPWSDPSWGFDVGPMQSSHFKILGFDRTYWQFYVGFGLSISVLMLLPAVTAWQLGNAQDAGRRTRAWTLIVTFAALTVLDCMFFFAIPIVFSALITLCLLVATLRMPSASPN